MRERADHLIAIHGPDAAAEALREAGCARSLACPAFMARVAREIEDRRRWRKLDQRRDDPRLG